MRLVKICILTFDKKLYGKFKTIRRIHGLLGPKDGRTRHQAHFFKPTN